VYCLSTKPKIKTRCEIWGFHRNEDWSRGFLGPRTTIWRQRSWTVSRLVIPANNRCQTLHTMKLEIIEPRTAVSRLGEPGFWSQPRYKETWLGFSVVFLDPPKQIMGYYFKICHDDFLSRLFQVVITKASYNSTIQPTQLKCLMT